MASRSASGESKEYDPATAAAATPSSLVALAEATTLRLNSVWDDVGESNRDEQLAQVYARVADVFEQAVQQAEAGKQAMLDRINQLLDDARKACDMMRESSEMIRDDASLPLVKRVELAERLHAVTSKKRDERVSALAEQHEKLHVLWRELGQVPSNAAAFSEIGNDLNSSRIADYMDQISQAQQLKNERLDIVRGLVQRIGEIWDELAMQPASDFDERIARFADGCTSELSVQPEVAEMLEAKLRQLAAERDQRSAQRDTLLAKLESLWTTLQTDESEQFAFLEANTGLGERTLRALEAECVRLRGERSAMLKTLIVRAREQMYDKWTELRYTPGQRSAFLEQYMGEYTDEVLSAFEAELARLDGELAELRPILKLIERRETARRDRDALNAATTDATRLTKRAHGDPGRLVREERMRREIAQLPKIEEKLVKLVVEWEAAHNKHFLANGVRVLSMLVMDTKRDEEEKEAAKRRREEEKQRKLKEIAAPYTFTPKKFTKPSARAPIGAAARLRSKEVTPRKDTPRPDRRRTGLSMCTMTSTSTASGGRALRGKTTPNRTATSTPERAGASRRPLNSLNKNLFSSAVSSP